MNDPTLQTRAGSLTGVRAERSGRRLSGAERVGASSTALGTIAILAMIAGLAQNVVSTYVAAGAVNYVDDALVLLMIPVAFNRLLSGSKGPFGWVFAWFLVLVVAFVQTLAVGTITTGDAFILFRQVTMPAILIFVGMTLTRAEWSRIAKATVWIGLLNVPYILLEVFRGIRLVDPSIIAVRKGLYIFPNGLPGHYMSFSDSGAPGGSIRAGGIYLNPPTTGILLALAASIAWNTRRGWSRWVFTGLLAFCTYETHSRGGLLVLAAGVGFAVLGKVIGRAVASTILLILGLLAAFELAKVSGSAIHLEGLIGGLTDAWNYPFGRGFGYAGNFTRHLVTMESAESLSGIAFSAGGVLAVALYIVLLGALVVRLASDQSWMAATALGLVTAAMVAETAGSLDATVPGWLMVGYVMVADKDVGRVSMTTVWHDRRSRKQRKQRRSHVVAGRTVDLWQT